MKNVRMAICMMLICLFSSPAFALDPMGPPTAGLNKGQSRIGFEYMYGEVDLEESLGGVSATLKNVESKRFYTNLGYGLTDDWELFLRLGLTDVEQDEFESDYDFAYGFGTKVTVVKDEQLPWGALFQVGWSRAEDNVLYDLSALGFGTVATNVEADWYEIQIAVGPTLKCNENWLIYGGPFLHFIEGDIDYKDLGISTDIEEESQFGGYIGTQIDFAKNTSLFVETQFTGAAYALGTGISWKF